VGHPGKRGDSTVEKKAGLTFDLLTAGGPHAPVVYLSDLSLLRVGQWEGIARRQSRTGIWGGFTGLAASAAAGACGAALGHWVRQIWVLKGYLPTTGSYIKWAVVVGDGGDVEQKVKKCDLDSAKFILCHVIRHHVISRDQCLRCMASLFKILLYLQFTMAF
jgi:hypothetical protein